MPITVAPRMVGPPETGVLGVGAAATWQTQLDFDVQEEFLQFPPKQMSVPGQSEFTVHELLHTGEEGGVGVSRGVGVGVLFGGGVAVGVGVLPGGGVSVVAGVGVGVGVCAVEVGVGVRVGLLVGVGVGIGFFVGFSVSQLQWLSYVLNPAPGISTWIVPQKHFGMELIF